MFVKAENDKIESLAAVNALMLGREVHRRDALQACLCNDCRSTMPIQYAARYIESFDVQDFVRELIEYLLVQPYRGPMLR